MITRRLLGGLLGLLAAALLGGLLGGLAGGCQPPRWARIDKGPEPTKAARRPRKPREQPVAQQEELARTLIRSFRDRDLAPDSFVRLQQMGCDAVPYLFTYALDPDAEAPEPTLRDSPEQLDDIYRIRIGAARAFEMIAGVSPEADFKYHADWPREDRAQKVKYLRRWWEQNEPKLRQQEAARRAAAAAAARRPPGTPAPPPPPIPARPTPTAPPPEVSPLPPLGG